MSLATMQTIIENIIWGEWEIFNNRFSRFGIHGAELNFESVFFLNLPLFSRRLRQSAVHSFKKKMEGQSKSDQGSTKTVTVTTVKADPVGTKKVQFQPDFTTLQHIFDQKDEKLVVGQTFTVCGHVRSAQVKFVHIYDGTTPDTLQLVFTEPQMKTLTQQYGPLYPSTTIKARVLIQKSQGAKQRYDAMVIENSCQVVGMVRDPTTFLPAIKNVAIETWRKRPDLRVHSRTQAAIFRIRSHLSWATHAFMKEKRVFHLDPNTITSADCEGAGEMFIVTTLGEHGLKSIPTRKSILLAPSKEEDEEDDKTTISSTSSAATSSQVANNNNEIDWRKDFFRNDFPCRLTVSSQLQLEALTPGVLHVYTTNPSYRAEPSNTTRHLASFTHVEAEFSFIEFKDLMDFEEEYVVHCFQTVLDDCGQDLQVLEFQYAPGVTKKLQDFISQPFARMSYDEAIKILDQDQKQVHNMFPEVKEIPKWGDDLGSYCERYLSEAVHKKPVFVYNMPAPLKSFYMRRNPDGKTVQGCDLLIPGMGELIGGSMRENNYHKLLQVMVERNMFTFKDKKKSAAALSKKEQEAFREAAIATIYAAEDDKKQDLTIQKKFKDLLQQLDLSSLQWYVDLRRNASTPTGGFGLGFERLVTVCTSNLTGANIRDSLPFPVAFKECHF
jgi:asparaginyl-tRNA synthetase